MPKWTWFSHSLQWVPGCTQKHLQDTETSGKFLWLHERKDSLYDGHHFLHTSTRVRQRVLLNINLVSHIKTSGCPSPNSRYPHLPMYRWWHSRRWWWNLCWMGDFTIPSWAHLCPVWSRHYQWSSSGFLWGQNSFQQHRWNDCHDWSIVVSWSSRSCYSWWSITYLLWFYACCWYLSGNDSSPHTCAAGARMSTIYDPRSKQATAYHAARVRSWCEFWVTNALTMLLPLARSDSSLAIMSPHAGVVTTLTHLYVLMAVITSARLLNDCSTFEQMQRCHTRKGFSIGSSHRVLCVRCAFHVIYCYVNFLFFFFALRFLLSLGCCSPNKWWTDSLHPRLPHRVSTITLDTIVESSIRIGFPRARELYCRLLPRGPRHGHDRIVLSLCSWFTLLQRRCVWFCMTFHRALLPMDLNYFYEAPLSPLRHRDLFCGWRFRYKILFVSLYGGHPSLRNVHIWTILDPSAQVCCCTQLWVWTRDPWWIWNCTSSGERSRFLYVALCRWFPFCTRSGIGVFLKNCSNLCHTAHNVRVMCRGRDSHLHGQVFVPPEGAKASVVATLCRAAARFTKPVTPNKFSACMHSRVFPCPHHRSQGRHSMFLRPGHDLRSSFYPKR